MRKTFVGITLLIFIAGIHLAYAQVPVKRAYPKLSYDNAYQVSDPKEIIRRGLQRIQLFLSANELADSAQIYTFLEKEIAPDFDFVTMTQLILGPLNYNINDQQRHGITMKIRRAFLTALASNLFHYRGGQVEVDSVRLTSDTSRGMVSVRVRLLIYTHNQYPAAIELRIAPVPEGWKIIDVSANGLSAVAHYRNFVRSTIQRSGLEGLLQ